MSNLEKAFELRDSLKKGFSERVAYGVVHEDGSTWSVSNGVCYALIYSEYREKPKANADYFVVYSEPDNWLDNGLVSSGLDHEAAINLFNWLANDSHWAYLFVSKDGEDMLKNGFVMITDELAPIIFNIANVNKYALEFPHRINFWQQFVNAGADPYTALALAHFVFPNEKGLYSMDQVFSGHSMIDGYFFNKGTLKNFINNDCSWFLKNRGSNGKHFRESIHYINRSKVWYDGSRCLSGSGARWPNAFFEFAGSKVHECVSGWGEKYNFLGFHIDNLESDLKVWMKGLEDA